MDTTASQGITMLLVTFPDAVEAQRVASNLLDASLIACANIFPSVTSLYRWEGRNHSSSEVVVLCKTSSVTHVQAMDYIKEQHSYTCPCIVSFPIDEGNREYIKWVETSCKVSY